MTDLPDRHAPCSAVRIGDRAPDFAARSTTGQLKLSDMRGKWVILFSHPADFTPVCTTEFVALANSYSAFAERDCELVALSIDSLFSHFAWLRMIRNRYGVEVRFPIIEDPTLVVGRAYGMVADGDADSSTVRSSFFIDPDGVVRAITCYPANIGRSVSEMLRVLDALQAADRTGHLAPAEWQPGEPLLESAVATDLDAVFSAPGDMDWFLSEAEPAK